MSQQQSLPTQECILSKKSLINTNRKRVLSEMDVQRYFQEPTLTPLDLTIFRHSVLFKYPQFNQFYQCLVTWNGRVKSAKKQYFSQLQIKAHCRIYEQLRRVQFIPQDKVTLQLEKLMNVSVIRKIMLNRIQQQPQLLYPKTIQKSNSLNINLSKPHSYSSNSISKNYIENLINNSHSKSRARSHNEIKDLCNHYRSETKNFNQFAEEREIKQQVNQIFKNKARFMAMRIKMRRNQCIKLTPLKLNKEKVDNVQEEQSSKCIQNVGHSTPKLSMRSISKGKQNIQSVQGITLIVNKYQNKIIKQSAKTDLKIKPFLRL